MPTEKASRPASMPVSAEPSPVTLVKEPVVAVTMPVTFTPQPVVSNFLPSS